MKKIMLTVLGDKTTVMLAIGDTKIVLAKEQVEQLVDSLQAWLIKGAEMPPVV